MSYHRKHSHNPPRLLSKMRYQFCGFILDMDQFELSKDGRVMRSEPQILELMALLIENNERMVSKEEILNTIWKGKVVSDSALSSRVKSARQLLGDDGQQQSIIRTIHGKGFRFVADVNILESSNSATLEVISDKQESDSPIKCSKSRAPAVAVLPFKNLSNDTDQDYFAEGMTDDIIAHLTKHRWLDVVARNTTFGYKGKSVDVRQLGRELKVNYIVDGSVQRAGNRIRVSAHLIDALAGHNVWSEKYQRTLDDIFAVQDDITAKIVGRLEPEIGFAERRKIVHSRPANLQTWDCYHLGIYHFYRFTGPDNVEAQKLLKQCQVLDPQFGEGFAWWAYALVLGMVYWNTNPSQTLLDQALSACDKAVELDDRNASFHALRGRILLARREYDAAIAANEIAISLNPTLASAHCGLGDSLAYEKRYDEALECFQQALTLSPNDPQLWAFYTYGALALLFKGDYQQALHWTERASNIQNYQYWTTAHRAVALLHLNRQTEACAIVRKLQEEAPQFTLAFAREKLFYLKEDLHVNFYLDSLRALGIS